MITLKHILKLKNIEMVKGRKPVVVSALQKSAGERGCQNKSSAVVYFCHFIILTDPAAGASDDWYKGVLKARFAYTIELRDTGRHGFILPPEQIIPSGEELWEAERVVFKKMVELS